MQHHRRHHLRRIRGVRSRQDYVSADALGSVTIALAGRWTSRTHCRGDAGSGFRPLDLELS
jgi:hypothetical protein